MCSFYLLMQIQTSSLFQSLHRMIMDAIKFVCKGLVIVAINYTSRRTNGLRVQRTVQSS